MWLLIFDLVLLIGMTLRLTRLVTTDTLTDPLRDRTTGWWNELLSCPFCIGFWIGVGTVASFYLWHGTDMWRLVAGAFTLNYLVGHTSARLD